MGNGSLLYWALRLAFALSRRLPLDFRYWFGATASEAVYWCWPSKRRNTCRNMAVAIGDGGGAASRAAARQSLRNYGRYIVDFLNLPNVTPAEIIDRTHVQGWEHLDRALAQGKGAIFVTGHVGLWDYAPAVLADRYPGRVHVVAESFKSARVDDLIQRQRAEQGSIVIEMSNVRGMIRSLRGNGILALLVDRPVHDDGVPVEFFGQPTMVPAGAATLAALTGAALLPGYLIHRPDGHYDGGILAAIEQSRTGERARDVQVTTQAIFRALERIIAHDPAHWFMFRDMWPRRSPVLEKADARA